MEPKSDFQRLTKPTPADEPKYEAAHWRVTCSSGRVKDFDGVLNIEGPVAVFYDVKNDDLGLPCGVASLATVDWIEMVD